MGLRGVLLVHGLALSVGWLAPGVHAPRARGAVRMAAFSGEEPWNPNAPTPRARERVSLSPIDMHELQARINFSREQQTLRERCERVYTILFNANTEHEGIYSIAVDERPRDDAEPGADPHRAPMRTNIVLGFENREDAMRYALVLKAQEVVAPEVIEVATEDLARFCEARRPPPPPPRASILSSLLCGLEGGGRGRREGQRARSSGPIRSRYRAALTNPRSLFFLASFSPRPQHQSDAQAEHGVRLQLLSAGTRLTPPEDLIDELEGADEDEGGFRARARAARARRADLDARARKRAAGARERPTPTPTRATTISRPTRQPALHGRGAT